MNSVRNPEQLYLKTSVSNSSLLYDISATKNQICEKNHTGGKNITEGRERHISKKIVVIQLFRTFNETGINMVFQVIKIVETFSL